MHTTIGMRTDTTGHPIATIRHTTRHTMQATWEGSPLNGSSEGSYSRRVSIKSDSAWGEGAIGYLRPGAPLRPSRDLSINFTINESYDMKMRIALKTRVQ